ncbi:hypothetical protein [Palleronia rufa]|uniref:hypothetical protein n=1 Tax=Palleronia rufa TaxID=1530186 RepID=UPI0013765B03|nr:hypothetical protein [Palleronia rufa]
MSITRRQIALLHVARGKLDLSEEHAPRDARSHGGCDRIHGSTGTGSTRSTAPAMRMSS